MLSEKKSEDEVGGERTQGVDEDVNIDEYLNW
jgi:hypothetical protein